MQKRITKLITLLVGCSQLTSLAKAGEEGANKSSSFEDLWDIPHLYSDSNAFWLTDLKLVGRYQWQMADVSSDLPDYSTNEIRRMRLGTEAKLLGGHYKVKAEFNIDHDGGSDHYAEEIYIQYNGDSLPFNVTLGLQKPKWSYELSTSSRKILTFERSQIINQLGPKKSAGISLSGALDKYNYALGVYRGDTVHSHKGGSVFGDPDIVGEFTLASIGQDYSETSRFDQSSWRFDWLHNTDAASNAAKPYDNSFSLNHSLQQGTWGLHSDLIHAQGDAGNDDKSAIVILPTYDLTDQLQLVARYTYANGDGLAPNKRYEGKAGAQKGDSYQSVYVGLNYYLNDHKLKLMSGIEFSEMDGETDYDAYTIFSGLRFYF
jgi:phosphate-selective porin OprO/OprP